MAAVLLLTSPFTPMLFMGEEWAASTPWPFFTSHPDADMAEKTRAGRLAEFARHGWDPATVPDPQDPATFESAKLVWSERGGDDHAAMLTLYRDLLRLRRSHPGIVTEPWRDLRVAVDEDARSIVVHRGGVTVVANLSQRNLAVPIGLSAAARQIAVTTDPSAVIDEHVGTITLPAMSAAVVV